MSVNRTYLTGKIVKPLEMKIIEQTGTVYAVMTIAVTKEKYGKSGITADFMPIKLWGGTIGYVEKNFCVGNNVFVECVLESYAATKESSGEKYSILTLSAKNVVMGGRGTEPYDEKTPASAFYSGETAKKVKSGSYNSGETTAPFADEPYDSMIPPDFDV